MHERTTRFLLDTNVFIAAAKRGWTKTNDEIALCLPFFPENQEADVLHAATCLSAGGILISNDKHFEKIRNAGIVEVWTISEAIERLL